MELGDRLVSLSLQVALPDEHWNALQATVQQLEGVEPFADALRVLKDAVAGHGALQQGRCALQSV